jgi:peroxiredoxin
VKTWVGRWLAALIVAFLVAMWPAYVAYQRAHAGPPGGEWLGFVLKDMSGKDVRLADFKGRPLIINFWATWCAPCKAEIPGFVALVDKYKAEQLTVLGVSIDDSAEELREFARKFKVNYPLLVGTGHDDLIAKYEVSFVPITWMIRRDGTVQLKKEGTETHEWFESQVKALF